MCQGFKKISSDTLEMGGGGSSLEKRKISFGHSICSIKVIVMY